MRAEWTRPLASGLPVRPRATPQAGFTLLETLIVMVLIAILASAAITGLNIVFDGDDAKTEAERFAALARLAAEEALLTGREYGMRIGEDDIRFYVFEDEIGQWQPLGDTKIFDPRPIPENLDFDLVLEGQAIVLGSAATDEEDERDSVDTVGDNDEQEIEQPQLMFLSSGEVTPYTLTIEDRDGEQAWEVESDLLGRVEIREVER